MEIILKAFFLIGLLLLGFEIIDRLRRSKQPIPASPKNGKFFDSNFRKYLQPPELIVNRSGLMEHMNVVDLGCGSGAFTTDAAIKVGEKGTVYALDLQAEMLSQLRRKLKRPQFKRIKNIKIIQNDSSKLPFESNSIDLVFMVDVLNEIPHKEETLREVKRVLKKDGLLAVTEFFLDPDFRFKNTTINLCKKMGYKVKKEYGNFIHYTIQFSR